MGKYKLKIRSTLKVRQDIGCYENSQWGDLLTSYDSMGNRTSYNGNTYTWVGRELKSVENGSSIRYSYNAEGDSKEVKDNYNG